MLCPALLLNLKEGVCMYTFTVTVKLGSCQRGEKTTCEVQILAWHSQRI